MWIFFEAEEEKKTLDLQKLASFQKLKSLFKNRAGASEYEIEIKPRGVVQEEVEVFSIIRLIFRSKDTIQPQYSFPYNPS